MTIGPAEGHLRLADPMEPSLKTAAGAEVAAAAEVSRCVVEPSRTASPIIPAASVPTPLMVATDFPPNRVGVHETLQHLSQQDAQGEAAGEV